MPFCSNCGNKLPDGAKFCNSCGNKINSSNTNNREKVYDGKIHKCPNCGEVLKSFEANCPACGYELRSAEATESVIKFYDELNHAHSVEQKDNLIRNFPIPNTKEDIIEFMILASSNLLGEDNRDIFEAWTAKFEQCYQKAQIIFQNDADFSKVQYIYNECKVKIELEKERRVKKTTIDTIFRNVSACAGIALYIVAIIVDRSHGNASFIELASCMVLIASAASLAKRGALMLDYIVCAISGLLVFLGSFLLRNGSLAQLCGAIVLITVAASYFKGIKPNKKE